MDEQDEIWLDSNERPMFRDRSGAPISLRRFSELFVDLGYKVVQRDSVGTQTVITAWLGIDQGNPFDADLPLIFGTIVREESGEFRNETEIFSSTEEEARATHQAVLSSL